VLRLNYLFARMRLFAADSWSIIVCEHTSKWFTAESATFRKCSQAIILQLSAPKTLVAVTFGCCTKQYSVHHKTFLYFRRSKQPHAHGSLTLSSVSDHALSIGNG